jgi:primosomal protein N' (replication factor Y)
MDADTTKGRGAHDRLLASFEALETGVLLGTQMIAKGLDYPDVTLVGVVAADVTLNLPDFRAGERTYQLLEQVAGRAGRGAKPGHVVLQTYWPDHRAVVAAASHEPEAFYASEALERRELGYPPFGRLCNVLIWGDDGGAVGRVAGHVAEELQSSVPEGWSVVGPSPAPLSRLKRAWRWHVLVKAPEGCAISNVLAESLARVPKVSGVFVVADVDPTDLL